jgi:hypothetical protein
MAKPNQITAESDAQEYRVIRKDLIFVIVMNLVFFAILIGLYFMNRSTGKVDSLFAHLLKF